MRKLTKIVVHHSATARHTTVEAIRASHKARGWHDIGYHFIITSEGAVHAGRPVELAGAHALRHNIDSIGVCVIGDNTQPGKGWNPTQIAALKNIVRTLLSYYPTITNVLGHRDLTGAVTACPGLDVQALLGFNPRENLMSSPTAPVPTEPRAASSPFEGGLRDAIKGALLVALVKLGLPAELSDSVSAAAAAAVGGLALGVLGFLGKFLRDYAASGKAPLWLRFVLKMLPL